VASLDVDLAADNDSRDDNNTQDEAGCADLTPTQAAHKPVVAVSDELEPANSSDAHDAD
jgi:hypothetical protein